MDIKNLNSRIDIMWAKLKANLLGNNDIGKAMLITSNIEPLSLPGLFDTALRESGGVDDVETLNGLLQVAGNYLEAEKAKLKAKLFNKISGLEAQSDTMSDVEALQFLDEEIGKIFHDTKVNISRIASAESQNVKNIAFLNGIVRTNEHFGIKDPTVVYLTTKDTDVCKDCRRLHCINGNFNKPRPWKLSQFLFDYAPKNAQVPSIHGRPSAVAAVY